MTAKKPAADVGGCRRCRSHGPAPYCCRHRPRTSGSSTVACHAPSGASMPPWASVPWSITALRRMLATTTVRALHLAG